MRNSLIFKMIPVTACFLVAFQAQANVLALSDGSQQQQPTRSDYFGNLVVAHDAAYYKKQNDASSAAQLKGSSTNSNTSQDTDNLEQLRQKMLAEKQGSNNAPLLKSNHWSTPTKKATAEVVRPEYIPAPPQRMFQTPTKKQATKSNNDDSITTFSSSNSTSKGFNVYQ